MKVLVIGAGVSGMTTALVLAREGVDISIWAKDMPENTTSAVAGAFWQPYLCYPKDKALRWSKYTREYLESTVQSDTASGVRPVRLIEYFDEPAEDPWWRPAVEVFGHVDKTALPDNYVDGYYADLFLMDTTRYLPWLRRSLQERGVEITQREVGSISEVPPEFDVVINCTGLGARELCNDNRIYPTRGQVVSIKKKEFDTVVADDVGHNNLVYIIPRYDDIILGGTAQDNDWNLDADPDDTEEILRKAKRLSPVFDDAEVISVKVGLRPTRDEIRLEAEEIDGRQVIHNYGHGGAGYTLSWGCAQEVSELLKSTIAKH